MAEPDPTNHPRATTWSSANADGTVVLGLAGDVDLSSIRDVRRAADAVLHEHPEQLVIDLAELTFMDSSGIALLLWIANRVPRVELRNASPIIRRLLELTGLTETLPIVQ